MNPKNIKIIFFGTPQFAADILSSLIKNKFNVAAAFSQPDKKVGRRQEIVFSPVKKFALENSIKVFQPESLLNKNVIVEVQKINPDLIVAAAYGKILPKDILKIPKYGAINIHASLLPAYRGASPVQCAILAGEKETGVTIMLMNEKMDEGDILAQEKIEIDKNETADMLLEKLSGLGVKIIAKLIPDWISGKIKPIQQDKNKATFCRSVKREDGKIDWNGTAEEIFRKWRAYQPWPGIFTVLTIKNQLKRLKILEIKIVPESDSGEKAGKIVKYHQEIAVQAKRGLVVLKKVQLEGRKEMNIEDFVMGFPKIIGTIME